MSLTFDVRDSQMELSSAICGAASAGSVLAAPRFDGSPALYRVVQGILLVGRQGEVLFANRAAEELLGPDKALRIVSHRLAAKYPPDTAALHRLIDDAVKSGIGDSLVLYREARPSMIALLVPLNLDTNGSVHFQPKLMVLVQDLERQTNPSLRAFAHHFGLTPAQAALARELIRADGVAAAAKRLGISYATARTHLLQIFQKTATRRQAELVRLMMRWDQGLAVSATGADDLSALRN